MKTSTILLAPLFAAFAFTSSAHAQQPPENAMPLSEVLAQLEEGGDVAYFDDIEWDDDGYWEIEYRRTDGGSVEIDVDPVSGEIRN